MSSAENEPQDIAWLVPCYNEAVTVGKVIDDIRKHCPQGRIYVYDNNSSDLTYQIACEKNAIVEKVPLQGKGYVISKMLQNITADVYIIVDGDDTYDIASWKKLILPLKEGYDMVVGKRISPCAKKSYRPFHRFGNYVISKTLSLVFQSKITDALSGYRALTFKSAKCTPINARGFEVETELTVQIMENRGAILEVETPYGFRPTGSHSKLSTWNDGFLILYTIIRLVKDYKPLTFCGILSLFSLAGCLSGLILNDLFLTGVCLIMSVLFLTAGMILNSIAQRAKEILQINQRRW